MKNSIQNSFYNPLTSEERVISLIRKLSFKEKKGDITARRLAASKIKQYLVETADGSFTLRSDARGNGSETMHTRHGALYEARVKFANPLKIDGKKEFAILDICSGLGINAAAALEKLLGSEKNLELEQIEIDMVEISLETLAASLIIPSPLESHSFIKKAVETYLIEKGFLSFQMEKEELPANLDLSVHCQDAREMFMNISETKKYDAVFLDPFSPQKSPELYSQEFLMKIRELLKDDGVILTYTSSAPVRYALIDAGLEVGEGPSLGRVGGTIASPDITKIPKPLNKNDERMIALSDVGIPFRDPELNCLPENMIKNRQMERIHARGNYKMASTVKTPVYLLQNEVDERIKRRVLKHLRKIGIKDLDSNKSHYLVCPQFQECVCHCEEERPLTSQARIKEMEKRLENITNNDYRFM